jgi:hypothetical protein
MRLRLALVAVTGLALLAPMSVRAEHCAAPIYLFSYVSGPADDPLDPQRKLGSPTVTSSAIGCVVIVDDIPETPGDDSDTDVIYPGSNTLVVRWLEGSMPEAGTLTFAGETYPLSFYATTNGAGAVVDSRQIIIDPSDSINGGIAMIEVCRSTEGDDCETRVYRTVA